MTTLHLASRGRSYPGHTSHSRMFARRLLRSLLRTRAIVRKGWSWRTSSVELQTSPKTCKHLHMPQNIDQCFHVFSIASNFGKVSDEKTSSGCSAPERRCRKRSQMPTVALERESCDMPSPTCHDADCGQACKRGGRFATAAGWCSTPQWAQGSDVAQSGSDVASHQSGSNVPSVTLG